MSLFRATTGWPASHFARRKYTRDTRAQLTCRRRPLYTREHASDPSHHIHWPLTVRGMTTTRPTLGLYVLILIHCQANTYTRRASAHSHSIYTGRRQTKLGRERK